MAVFVETMRQSHRGKCPPIVVGKFFHWPIYRQ